MKPKVKPQEEADAANGQEREREREREHFSDMEHKNKNRNKNMARPRRPSQRASERVSAKLMDDACGTERIGAWRNGQSWAKKPSQQMKMS